MFSARLEGSTAGGTNADSGSCGGAAAPDAAFFYYAPRAGIYTIDTIGSAFDSVLYARDGITELGCNDDISSPSNRQSRLTLALTSGQSVTVVVDGHELAESGNFILRINADCPLPDTSDPRDLGSAMSVSISGSTTCGANLAGGSQCGASGGRGSNAPDALFLYTAPTTAAYAIDTIGSSFDTILSLRDETSCPGAELPFGCNDDIEPGTNLQSRVTVALLAGQRIRIAVDGYDTASGPFQLHVDALGCCQRLETVSVCEEPVSAGACAGMNGEFFVGATCEQGTCVFPPPTPTHTSSATPTRTITNTPSLTATRSATRTHTPTRTPSSTPTSSATRTSTGTQTHTATRTSTRTATVTRTTTASHTSTATRTATPSPTVSPTLTPSATPSATSVPSASPTSTPSPSVTPTVTPSATLVQSPTPTGTLPPSATPSVTATPSSTRISSPSPTATSRETATATRTRTPTATPTATVEPATIELLPVSGIAGSELTAHGRVSPATPGVRIFWDDGFVLRGLGEGPVNPDGSYELTLLVPEDAAPGGGQLCAIGSGPGGLGLDMACAAFTVLLTPPGGIIGQVLNESGAPVPDAIVRLITDAGAPIASTVTDASGGYSFSDLPPGDYLVGARCSEAGSDTGCSPARDYFPVDGVSVLPGSSATGPLTGVPPPLDSAALPGFGAIALPGGALSATSPVRVTRGVSGVVAHLGSLQGRGLAPLTVRVWADVEFFDELFRAKAVRFQILRGGEVIELKTAAAPQAVWSEDPYTFSAYVADFNVNEFPPGDLTLRITPRLGGFSLTPHDFTLRMEDLGGRWFNDWVTDPAVAITAGGSEDLIYRFTGLLPSPAFNFDEPINLPFDTRLDNIVTLGIPIEEALHTDETWSGAAKAAARATFLSLDFIDETRSYNGPTGFTLTDSAYALDRIHKDLFGKKCVPIPQLSYCIGYEVDPCFICPNISLGIWLTTDLCVQGFVDLDSTIQKTLRVNATVSPGATVSVPIELKVGAAVCSGSAKAEPSATATLPIYYDPDRDPLFGFDNPCLELSASLDYKVKCVGLTVTSGSTGLGELRYGCSSDASAWTAPLTVPLGQEGFTVGELSPRPAVASDGAGHALGVWIQDLDGGAQNPDRRLFYSFYDGRAWLAPAGLNNVPALVDEPKVAFLGSDHALAVWVQSRLRLEEALASDQTTLLSNSELYFAEWDGSGWSAAAPITDDALFDASPSLAGDPATGTAALVWLRVHEDPAPGESPMGVYVARFDGAQWSAPERIAPSSQVLDHPPTVKFDRAGRATVLWLRDMDGDFLTSEDRQIVMSRLGEAGWSAPEAIPDLPAGAYTPSLAFDTANHPIVVFVVPPLEVETGRLGSGDGNASQLYAAYRRGEAWEVGPVGENTYAERPVVAVNADNRAIIVHRRFGDTGDVHVSGDVASAVANLNAQSLEWTTGFLTADGQVNWEVAFDVDDEAASNFVLNVKKRSAAAAQAPSRTSKSRRVGGRVASQVLVTGDVAVASAVVPYAADLAIAPEDIAFSDPHPLAGDSGAVTATVRNAGLKAAGGETSIAVAVYVGDVLLGRRQITAPIPFNGAAAVSVPHTVQRGGLQAVRVVVDEDNAVAESDETNNAAQAILGQVPPPGNLSAMVDDVRGRLTLRWDAPQTRGISRYRVYRSTNSGAGYELVGGSVDTEFVDALAARSTPYYYTVAATDEYGVISPFATEVSAMVPAPACPGDCGADGTVTVDELIVAINIALGTAPLGDCSSLDPAGDGAVTVDELVAAVNNALEGCPEGP